ncbi:hypothetical protein GCM10010302_05900 [Streptomyces polychromogenes]|uniref:Uncharacterized protein n=1 Tax=Streptomyces polychromogenes TaxID=67342 RepID=A0ABN0V1W9_9ACTN
MAGLPGSGGGDGLEGEGAQGGDPVAGFAVVDGVGADGEVAAGGGVEVEAGAGEAVVVGDVAGGDDPGQASVEAGFDRGEGERGGAEPAVRAAGGVDEVFGVVGEVAGGGEDSGVAGDPAEEGGVVVVGGAPDPGGAGDAALGGDDLRAAGEGAPKARRGATWVSRWG